MSVFEKPEQSILSFEPPPVAGGWSFVMRAV